MQVVILPTADAVGDHAARIIIRGVTSKIVKVLGVATGTSPLPVYRAMKRLGLGNFSDLTAFALDEYVGLPHSHSQSYHSIVDREVTQALGLRRNNVHVPNSAASDINSHCDEYEDAIRAAGGIDLQILGIGSTGHIGFNEPTSSFASRTRIKTLSKATRADNARFFNSPETVPKHAITQGLATIMDAREIILVAHGNAKSDAIERAVEGPLSSMCPASILQMHPQVTIILDESAASKLSLADYYRFTFENQSAVQA